MGTEKSELRILQVTARYLPFIGGVENHVYQVSKRLVRKGVEVTVLTTNPQNDLPEFETLEGVRIERVRAWPAQGDLYFAPAIYPRITNGRWDVIHIQSYHTLVPPVAMMAARKARIPYVITFHGGGHSSRLRSSIRKLQRKLLRPLLNHAERLIAVAQFEIPFYGRELNFPPERFSLIPNGTDMSVSPVSRRDGHRDPLIVSVGRLERYKGHQRVIEAMPALVKAVPDVRLWIAGSGPYEPNLRALVNKYDLADRVDIHAVPASNREEMAAELSNASLVVLLSDFETHPISILEAASLGIPALVTDTSGLRELAQKGLANAIPLHSSPEEIAAAIIDQIHHRRTLPSISLPTWDECTNQLLTLYQSVAKPT